MKRCSKCGITKEFTEFYRYSEMLDGHLNECKDCKKAATTRRRQAHPEVMMTWRNNNREYLRQYTKDWLSAHPDWQKTYRQQPEEQRKCQARRATRKLKHSRPAACQRCCNDSPVLFKHHHDYSKPLDIVWLCQDCHVIADRERRQQERHADN